jgi:cargo-transport protein YPP1
MILLKVKQLLRHLQRGNQAQSSGSPYKALPYYEEALAHFPDHAEATIGLCNILLDIYELKVVPPPSGVVVSTTVSSAIPTDPILSKIAATQSQSALPSSKPLLRPTSPTSAGPSPFSKKSPIELNRLAARDRAFGLLSALTKLGSGWDRSDAWFALSRAYELGGQIEKAKSVLWWCVELEEGRAVRSWGEGVGGLVL